jgi:hypothetical protein
MERKMEGTTKASTTNKNLRINTEEPLRIYYSKVKALIPLAGVLIVNTIFFNIPRENSFWVLFILISVCLSLYHLYVNCFIPLINKKPVIVLSEDGIEIKQQLYEWSKITRLDIFSFVEDGPYLELKYADGIRPRLHLFYLKINKSRLASLIKAYSKGVVIPKLDKYQK